MHRFDRAHVAVAVVAGAGGHIGIAARRPTRVVGDRGGAAAQGVVQTAGHQSARIGHIPQTAGAVVAVAAHQLRIGAGRRCARAAVGAAAIAAQLHAGGEAIGGVEIGGAIAHPGPDAAARAAQGAGGAGIGVVEALPLLRENRVAVVVVAGAALAQHHRGAEAVGIGPAAAGYVAEHVAGALAAGAIGAHLHRRTIRLGALDRVAALVEPALGLQLHVVDGAAALIHQVLLAAEQAALVVSETAAETAPLAGIRRIGHAVIVGIGRDRHAIAVVLAAADHLVEVVVALVAHDPVGGGIFCGLHTALARHLAVAPVVGEFAHPVGADAR